MTDSQKHAFVSDDEIYFRIVEKSTISPVILTEKPGVLPAHSKQAYLGIDLPAMTKILDEAGKYYGYRLGIINRIIEQYGLWTEKFHFKGRGNVHIFVNLDDVDMLFPECCDLTNSIRKYNEKVRTGEWAMARDYFDQCIVTAELEPRYPDFDWPYLGINDEVELELPNKNPLVTTKLQKVKI